MTRAIVKKSEGNGAAAAQKPKSAYISAPSYLDTSAVRKLLASKGVKVFSPDELDLPGRNITEIVREAMREADLVVAVVDPTPESNFVCYEIGFAQALEKPTFALVVGGSSLPAWLTNGVPYFRFDPDNPIGLDFAVSQMLIVSPHGSAAPPGASKRTHALGERANQLLEKMRAAGDRLTEGDFELIVTSAIRESGVRTLAQGGREDNSVDLAVWSDDLSPWVGNPLAVKLCLNLRGAADLKAKTTQLALAMARQDMPWGLLIYGSSVVESSLPVPCRNVIAISTEEFLGALRDTGFGDLIRRLRNWRVHGGV